MTHRFKIRQIYDIDKSYFQKSVTELISDIFEDQGEGVVMVKHPII